VNSFVWFVWTIAILLPFSPFSYLQPIMVGGGAGTWFLLGYVLFFVVAVLGFALISALLFTIEFHERRMLNHEIMLIGFILLYVGALSGCILLGIAGVVGGYPQIIQNSTVSAAQDVLSQFVTPTTAACSLAVVGAALTVYAMATAKARRR